ncbi:hypothetical protein CLV57_2871 [Mucilaginibacter auburnensis]|uniref:LPXTG-motif cell wall-anchored protein n=2 Tax=Mucilaginibacter auburnensis TaxID=1457233 RepID=A0A2H9VN30_9SPHI|nr:hypothetical protein CLV57_2871 [Mucilaginibacter auburnensis]
MMLSAALLFFTAAGFAQQLEPVKIDSLVTVSLPASYNKVDTLDQQVYSANSDLGYMVVVKATEDNNKPLEKENDLNKVMDNYVDNFKHQYKDASAQNVRDTTVGPLKAKAFTLEYRADDSSVQFKNFVLLYTTGASYFFQYAYPSMRSDVVGNELKTFLSSIKVSPQLSRTDQYLSNDKGMSPVVKTGLIAGGSLLVVALVVVWMNKRKQAIA